MAQTIERVEIFSTGVHHGSETIDVSEDDLSEMVASFEALGRENGFKPVLKLGHEDAQTFFGQKKGAPNLGFVEKIWKEGGKILANFSNVPDALVELIKQRRYNAVSIELMPEAKVGGTVFSNVLTAVALLGAELPAVKGLADLAASLFTEKPAHEFEGKTVELEETIGEKDMATYTQEQVDALVASAVSKAKEELTAEFEGKIADLTKAAEDAANGQKTAEDALRQFEADTHKREAEGMVEQAIKDGKILPKQKDQALAFAMSLSGKIKFGDKETSAADLFKDFVEGLPKGVDLGEHGATETKDGDKTANAAEEVDKRAKALVAEKKAETYADARQIVLQADPELKQRYFNMEE